MSDPGEPASSTVTQLLSSAGHKLSSMLQGSGLDEGLPSNSDDDRPSIKVRIMTWNMHGSIPKGDLEILFGHCDEYDPTSAPRPDNETPPPLPLDSSHPYHLLVLCCQECPWGDGGQLQTTLHTAGEIGSLARIRTRVARDMHSGEHRRAEGTGISHSPDRSATTATNASPDSHSRSDSSPTAARNRRLFCQPSSINVDDSVDVDSGSPQSPHQELSFLERNSARGWSKICEDWLCYATPPSYLNRTSRSFAQEKPPAVDLDPRQNEPMPSVGQTMDRVSRAPSPTPPTPSTPTQQESEQLGGSPGAQSLDMRLPPRRLGPYELVIKERMMGCYSAVYVWRPCYDLVHGASSNMVKSGLLAGRMGNKGGVGISVHFGKTRLLFVNAHLAGMLVFCTYPSACKQNQIAFR